MLRIVRGRLGPKNRVRLVVHLLQLRLSLALTWLPVLLQAKEPLKCLDRCFGQSALYAVNRTSANAQIIQPLLNSGDTPAIRGILHNRVETPDLELPRYGCLCASP